MSLLSSTSALCVSSSRMLGASLPLCLSCFDSLVCLWLSHSATFPSVCLSEHFSPSSSRSPHLCHSPHLLSPALFLGLFPQSHGCLSLCLSKDPANPGRPYRPGGDRGKGAAGVGHSWDKSPGGSLPCTGTAAWLDTQPVPRVLTDKLGALASLSGVGGSHRQL